MNTGIKGEMKQKSSRKYTKTQAKTQIYICTRMYKYVCKKAHLKPIIK